MTCTTAGETKLGQRHEGLRGGDDWILQLAITSRGGIVTRGKLHCTTLLDRKFQMHQARDNHQAVLEIGGRLQHGIEGIRSLRYKKIRLM